MGRLTAGSKYLKQRGDTIVEVLISVAVIGIVIAGAFVVAQSSSHAIQASQEHGYALQLLQGQVESARSLASLSGSPLGSVGGSSFCIANGTVSSGNNCVFNNLYNISIVKGSQIAGTNLYSFTFAVNWDKLGGGTNRESIVYGMAVN